ncbi:MAG: nuclear transport factor 2 family protein [bacterium]|nr:nuclear transport factor 2 family protein [bacterium]
MASPIDVARAFEAAWQAKDLDRARGYLADRLSFDSPFGHADTAEAAMQQYTGFAQAVTGPAREIAAFGDEASALIMSEIPTSLFGNVVSAAHYLVQDGRITSETIVYDATTAKTGQPQTGQPQTGQPG